MGKAKDAKRLKEYDILAYTKGFIAQSIVDGNTINDYFQYKQIYNIIHHPNVGIEIIGYNGSRRIFYHDDDGDTIILFNLVTDKMLAWMQSNKN